MSRAAVALLLCAATASAADPDPKSLAVPPAVAARARGLVGLLASRDYAERIDATNELRKLGRLALPTLRDTLASDSNPEVRLRIEMLLPAARAADAQARVACLLADTDGKYQHDLPGGKAFFAAAGRTESARQLYADMIRSDNRGLLLAVDGPEADLRRKLDARRGELNLVSAPGRSVLADATAVDVATVLFVESLLPDTGTATTGFGAVAGKGRRLSPAVSNTRFLNAVTMMLANEDRREALSGVLRHWMETRQQPQSAYSAITAMNRAGLPDALPAARNLAGEKVTGGPVTYRAQAIAYLGRFGTADDLPAIEKLFAEEMTLVTAIPNGPAARRRTVQVRDLALAMALLLTKQEPTDYGLDFRYGVRSDSALDTQKFNTTAYYFDAETEADANELRAAAFRKYKLWKEKQKKDK